MGSWVGDVKVSWRQLGRTPVFTTAAVVVLALGIGLNAAMFSLVYALAIVGRPYAEPDRLVQLYASRQSEPDSYRAFSYPAYRQIADDRRLFAGVLAHSPTIVGLSEDGQSRRTFAFVVSRNYFDVLGVPLLRGRGFDAGEDRPGQDAAVVIVTHAYWQRMGGREDFLGSTIRVNERPYTVIGITPRGFTGTMMVFGPELFFPFGVFHSVADNRVADSAMSLSRPDGFNLFVVARLAPGTSREAAAERLRGIGPALADSFPLAYQDARVTLGPLPRFGTSTSPSDESALGVLGAVLLGLTAAVLLTVCLNLASMLMARGRARRKEFAIRLAIGGRRSQIVRQLLVEGFLLSLAGGAGGVALGLGAIGALVDAFAAALPIAIVLDGAVSPALLAASLIFCLLATVWFALGPALRHSRADVFADLKTQAGDEVRRRPRPWMPRHPLLVAQVALSLALLIAAGLFVRMAQIALAADFGVRADDTVLAEVDSRLGDYRDDETLPLYASIEQRLAALPGVERASVAALVPLGMVDISRSLRRADVHVPAGAQPTTAEDGRAFDAPWNAVSGGYFASMGVPILQGRTFTESESFSADAARVVILDEVLARALWPDGGALGQRVSFVPRGRAASPPEAMEVVGIVGATRRQLFEKMLPGGVYVPFGQGAASNAFFHVRPAAADAALADTVRNTIRAVAPALPIFSVRTYAAHVRASVEYWALRLTAALFAAFGALAMLVALIGIYGVMSYSVGRRTREIGIRLAVGATASGINRMIVREGLTVTLAGISAGWVLGLGVGRVLGSLFVDVSSFDGLVFTAVPMGFVSAAMTAAWLAARRATGITPVRALAAD